MIGMLGGTFDPVHLGHISIALEVAERLQLESLQLVPCHLPVHRDPAHGNPEDRLAMLELAVADYPELQINDLEIRRGGQSYTVDTLKQLRQQNDSSMVFIMGSDAYNGFLDWREPEQILSLASLVVCHRPGVPINPDIFAERQVTSIAEFTAAQQGMILSLAVEENPCASTSVRQSLIRGKLPTDCLHPSVLHYIEERNLYRRQGA